MIDCKIREIKRRQHIGLQMYEIKIIQFAIFGKSKMAATLYMVTI